MAAKSEWGAWTCTLTIVKYLIIQPQNLQTSIIRTTRRNGKRELFVTTAYYSNWNPCTADFIQQEALFNSGENEVLSIEEDFPERNIVYCHTSHMYLSSTPLAFLGGVKLMATFLLRMQVWVDCEWGEVAWKSAVPDAYCRFHCYEVWGFSESQKKH